MNQAVREASSASFDMIGFRLVDHVERVGVLGWTGAVLPDLVVQGPQEAAGRH